MRHIKFGGSWFQAEIRKTKWRRKTVIFENSMFSEINRGTASHYPYSPLGGWLKEPPLVLIGLRKQYLC